ncbi:10179_t:CDS:2 [Dentiscutata heterogama]|uniref:10179_t:CDS:1 n=1 Tax=Dentiscutata heterogama TaxID=1316150 RepID=A0ACA9MN97_9GLOM|nr:10179_t:CDS:2 [Dentiscutata heterogama]
MELSDYKTPEQISYIFKNKFLNEVSLKENEKAYLIKRTQQSLDAINIITKKNKKRKCESCQNYVFAFQYCENCICYYLQQSYSNWTSGNKEIDDAIQNAQKNTSRPDHVIEWVPFEDFEMVQYLNKGGYASIYKAEWRKGRYDKWNAQLKILERCGMHEIILKMLTNSCKKNSGWLNEIITHFIYKDIRQLLPCYGLTKNQNTGDFMLILERMEYNLREYLFINSRKLTWTQSGHENDAELALGIIRGKRPHVDDSIPYEYATLIRQCWHDFPDSRPNALYIYKKISSLYKEFIGTENNNILGETFMCNGNLSNFTENLTMKSSKLYDLSDLSALIM